MNIHIDFKGIPVLYKALGRKKEIDFEFPGNTLRELMDNLLRRYGDPMKKAILDNNGNIDMEIRVVLNNTRYLTDDRMATLLNDGDILAFRGAS